MADEVLKMLEQNIKENTTSVIERVKNTGEKLYDEFKGNLKGNVPSLNAFFWLQHHYGYHPFESGIVYKDTSRIKIENE